MNFRFLPQTIAPTPLGNARLCIAAGLIFTIAACSDNAGVESDAQATESSITSGFEEPELSAEEKSALLRGKYKKLDPSHVVPQDLLGDAVSYLDANTSRITNKSVLTVVDFAKPSSKKRFFLIDLKTGKVEAHAVAHGSGSDPSNTGTAKKFGNQSGSNMTSLGYFLAAEAYTSGKLKIPRAVRLDGLSSTNSAVRARGVVVHGANYVGESRGTQGRSQGCLALDPAIHQDIQDRIEGGSLVYAGLSTKSGAGTSTKPAETEVEDDEVETDVAEDAPAPTDNRKPTPAGEPSTDGEPEPADAPAPRTTPPACVPVSAAELCGAANAKTGLECGMLPDGCGGKVNCDSVRTFGCAAEKVCDEDHKCSSKAGTSEPTAKDVSLPAPGDSADSANDSDNDEPEPKKAAGATAAPKKKAAESAGCSAGSSSSSGGAGASFFVVLLAACFARRRRG